MIYFYLAIGSVAGAILRYQLGLWIPGLATDSAGFPWSTLLINVSGSLVMGFLVEYFDSSASTKEIKLMLTVGFCGSFTTFSTFSHETISLFKDGRLGVGLLYVGLSFALAGGGYVLGYLGARALK
ncbi:MAG: fluoride efflux transporter CrcB [bacterium]